MNIIDRYSINYRPTILSVYFRLLTETSYNKEHKTYTPPILRNQIHCLSENGVALLFVLIVAIRNRPSEP